MRLVTFLFPIYNKLTEELIHAGLSLDNRAPSSRDGASGNGASNKKGEESSEQGGPSNGASNETSETSPQQANVGSGMLLPSMHDKHAPVSDRLTSGKERTPEESKDEMAKEITKNLAGYGKDPVKNPAKDLGEDEKERAKVLDAQQKGLAKDLEELAKNPEEFKKAAEGTQTAKK